MSWEAAGFAVSALGSWFGGNKAADAARRNAELQNQAMEAQFVYDKEAYAAASDKLVHDREHIVSTIEANARNNLRQAQWQDAVNTQQYIYDLQIRNNEQASLDQQYKKSTDIYNIQLSLNAAAEETAKANELRRFEEIRTESAFDIQEQRIQSLIARDKLRARGVDGRSITKADQATLADLGRQMEMINEAISGAGRNTKAILAEIARDRVSADLSAYAQKMAKPGVIPTPIVPYKTPLAEYVLPRELEPFDFGPVPIRGAKADPNAAANQVWGTALASTASNLGGLISTFGPD